MAWTQEQKLDYLLRLPWTIVPETTPEGDRLLRVRELRAAVGHGETDDELIHDFWESLRSTLLCYIHFNDPIPLPEGEEQLPWLLSDATVPEARRLAVESAVAGAVEPPTAEMQEVEDQTALQRVWGELTPA
jgi:hypothetical protein